MDQTFQDVIAKLYAGREYRPVGVVILYRETDGQRQFLITQAAEALRIWAFPQGGVELSETLDQNLSRELTEELSIDIEKDLSDIVYDFHYETLDYESIRNNKRGFTKGKAYFFTLAKYVGDGNLELQSKEVADAKWMTYEEAIEHFNKIDSKKAALSKKTLDEAIRFLAQ